MCFEPLSILILNISLSLSLFLSLSLSLSHTQTGSGKTYKMGTGFDVTVLPEEQGTS